MIAALFAKPPAASRVASLLDLDPELGRLMDPERRAQARVELLVPVYRRLPGPWPAITTLSAATPHRLGLLILDGVLTRDVYLEDVVGTELLGAGDLLQPWAPAGPERLLGDEACGRCWLSAASRSSIRVVRSRWPAIPRFVGARRPTVSTAFAELSRQGKVQRRDDGGWLLRGEPTGVPAVGQERVLSRRRLLTDLRSAEHERAPGNGVDVDELEFRLRRLRREAETLQAELTRRCEAVALPRRPATTGSSPRSA